MISTTGKIFPSFIKNYTLKISDLFLLMLHVYINLTQTYFFKNPATLLLVRSYELSNASFPSPLIFTCVLSYFTSQPLFFRISSNHWLQTAIVLYHLSLGPPLHHCPQSTPLSQPPSAVDNRLSCGMTHMASSPEGLFAHTSIHKGSASGLVCRHKRRSGIFIVR